MKELIFAGVGNIGVVCLQALQKKVDKIYIIHVSDDNILKLKRENDIIIDDFDDSHVKFVFLAGWFKLIEEKKLKNKKYINIHGSLLPKYRGMHSVFWAIMNFENEIGYTIHEVNENIDDGDILYQYKFFYKNQTIAEVLNFFYTDLFEKLGEVVIRYMLGETSPTKQDKDLATWVPKRNLDDCIIDFNWSNTIINRFFLALSPPYPLPRVIIKDVCYEILGYKTIDRDYFCDTGRVVNVDEEGVWIKTKDGLLVISLLKNVESKKMLDPKGLTKIGYRFKNNKRSIYS